MKEIQNIDTKVVSKDIFNKLKSMYYFIVYSDTYDFIYWYEDRESLIITIVLTLDIKLFYYKFYYRK